jgi:hypothetical protein
MNDIERDYRDRLKLLEGMLDGIDRQIKFVAERIANGAILNNPEPFSDPELTGIQDELFAKADDIVERMTEVHKALVSGVKR